MKDFFGQDLAVGDYVAFEQPKYRNLVLGIIVAFTPEQVRLYWTNPNYSSMKNLTAMDGSRWSDEFRAYPMTLVKRPHVQSPEFSSDRI